MVTTKYLERIKLPDPNWSALVAGIRQAMGIIEGKQDHVRAIRASGDSLEALELALTLDENSGNLGGMYKGAALLPEGSLQDGDFVVVGGEDRRVLVYCEPWDPYWVENHKSQSRTGYDDKDSDPEDEKEW